MNAGRGGKGRSLSWNTRRLSRDKLRKHLEETSLIDELGWARSAGLLEDSVQAARRKVVAACDTQCLAVGIDVPGTRCTGGATSCLSCVENASQRSIPRAGTSASRRWCGIRFQTTCCE